MDGQVVCVCVRKCFDILVSCEQIKWGEGTSVWVVTNADGWKAYVF